MVGRNRGLGYKGIWGKQRGGFNFMRCQKRREGNERLNESRCYDRLDSFSDPMDLWESPFAVLDPFVQLQ